MALPTVNITYVELLKLEFLEKPPLYYDIKIHENSIYFYIMNKGKSQIMIENNLKNYKVLLDKEIRQSEYDKHCYKKNIDSDNAKMWKIISLLVI